MKNRLADLAKQYEEAGSEVGIYGCPRCEQEFILLDEELDKGHAFSCEWCHAALVVETDPRGGIMIKEE